MNSLPPDYWQALALLGHAASRYTAETGRRVVVVGGAAVSFYTQGQVLSGDIDMVGDLDFEPFLLAEGFQKEDRPGRLQRGYYHADLPRLGLEFVSGPLFDGRADRDKITAVAISAGSEVLFPAVEDLIADRLGQFAGSGNRDQEMLEQARLLISLAQEYDPAYLRRRIIEEGGDPAALGLRNA